MRTILLLLTVVLLACTVVPAQEIDNSAPVVWQRYKVSSRKVSFLLPKLPTVHETPSICGEVKSVTYIAYAKGVIYEVTIGGPRTQSDAGKLRRKYNQLFTSKA